jgi:hypothetical protein
MALIGLAMLAVGSLGLRFLRGSDWQKPTGQFTTRRVCRGQRRPPMCSVFCISKSLSTRCARLCNRDWIPSAFVSVLNAPIGCFRRLL